MTSPLTPEQIAEASEVHADLLERWDCICDADPIDCDYDAYIERMERDGYMEIAPVDREALESAFAWDRGIEPGGMMYRLTPLGLSVRKVLQDREQGGGE